LWLGASFKIGDASTLHGNGGFSPNPVGSVHPDKKDVRDHYGIDPVGNGQVLRITRVPGFVVIQRVEIAIVHITVNLDSTTQFLDATITSPEPLMPPSDRAFIRI